MSMAADSIRWAVKCRGHRSNGEPCKRWAIRGGYVCPTHGGRAPQVRRAAERRLLEIAAHRALDAYLDSPTYREAKELEDLAVDGPAVEAFAQRIA